MNITETELRDQLARAENTGWWKYMKYSCQKYGVEVATAAAIASRETNMTNEVGDFGHGFGPMQLDSRSHRTVNGVPIQRAPVNSLLDACVHYLGLCLQAAKHAFPDYTEDRWFKIAAAGYNAGIGPAIRSADRGDSDKVTTGKDYGADCVERRSFLREWLK